VLHRLFLPLLQLGWSREAARWPVRLVLLLLLLLLLRLSAATVVLLSNSQQASRASSGLAVRRRTHRGNARPARDVGSRLSGRQAADSVGARVVARSLCHWPWRGHRVDQDRGPLQFAGDVVLVLLAVGGLLRVQLCFWLGLRRVRREEHVRVGGEGAARLVLLVATQDPEQQADGDQAERDGDADGENFQFAGVLSLCFSIR
jgi:hypothetical protein